jgi:hypothetical protein
LEKKNRNVKPEWAETTFDAILESVISKAVNFYPGGSSFKHLTNKSF